MTNPKNPDSAGHPASESSALEDYQLVVAVCGGIAAYKTAALVSKCIQQGAGVTVAMTAASQRFVTPLTFESLTARRVFTSLWDVCETHNPQHIHLTELADLFIIAPATANMIGKIACGICDDLVSTMVMSADCPVLLAPAMNTRMWKNVALQRNVKRLKEAGIRMVPPEEGWLACRTVGEGRMAEPDAILETVMTIVSKNPPKRVPPG